MDVNTAFLNGVIEEEVYVEQPQRFEVLGRETHVCRLRRALYGLKQVPRACYSRINTYLQQMGFTKSGANPNLYYIVVGDDPLILVLYVDALFITRAKRLISGCKEDLAMEFKMKDIVLMHYFLGLEVWQEEGCIFLGQGQYVVDVLSRFHMADCRPMSTPMITNRKKLHASDSRLVDPTFYRQLIGSLMYLVNTRPNICFVVNRVRQFMVKPRRVHWVVAKHILRYVQGFQSVRWSQRESLRCFLSVSLKSFLVKAIVVEINKALICCTGFPALGFSEDNCPKITVSM